MARGFQEHQARQFALSALGKDLARRAKSKCEVCEASGVPLKALEVPPVPREPALDTTILVCERCLGVIENPKAILPAQDWRILESTVWSQVPAAQVVVVRLLRRVALNGDWARELLEDLYLDETIMEWAGQG